MASIDQAALRELRRRFQGQVIAPDDPRYDRARRIWNAMVDSVSGHSSTDGTVAVASESSEPELF
jgi:hypothetical protein